MFRQTTRPLLTVSVVLVLSANCVNLNKPPEVESCARTRTCADDPTRDAATDSQHNADRASIADFKPADTAADAAASDTMAFDGRDASLESSATSDTHDDGSARDVVPDESPFASDGPADQSSKPDTGSDIGPESAREPHPELPPELAREPQRELSPELAPEPAPEPGNDAGDSGSGNCITQIINNGYAYESVASCSACKENLMSLATKCMGMLDCLAPPSTKADMTNCLNKVGGSQPVYDCVSALTTAACPSGF